MRLSETWTDNAINCVIVDDKVLPFGMKLYNSLKIDLESVLHYLEVSPGAENLNLKTNTVVFNGTNCKIVTITDNARTDVLKYFTELIPNSYITENKLIHKEPTGQDFLYCDQCNISYNIALTMPVDDPLLELEVPNKKTITFSEIINSKSKRTRIFLLDDKTYIVSDDFKMTSLKEIDSLDEGNGNIVFDATLRGQNIAIRTKFDSFDVYIKPERDYPNAAFDNIQARNLGAACNKCGNMNLIKKTGDVIITITEEKAPNWTRTVYDIDYAKILRLFALNIPTKFRIYYGIVIPEDYKDEKCLELAEAIVIKMFNDKVPVLYDDREIPLQDKKDQAFIHRLIVHADGKTTDEPCEKDEVEQMLLKEGEYGRE